MKINRIHDFDIDIPRAKRIQLELAERVKKCIPKLPSSIDLIAGCDVAFDKNNNLALGAVVILNPETLEVLKSYTGKAKIRIPYIPGYLSFREMEVLCSIFENVEEKPDIVYVDGQGIAHPRRIGLASHLGLFLDTPTIGCAKSRLIGDYQEPSPKKGSRSPLTIDGERVGYVLRTRDNVKPIFVSPGYKIDIESAVDLALKATGKYKIPEPTRQADREVARYKREGEYL